MTGKENQLKKENQQLRNEIGELKKQLDKLTKEIGHRREEIDPDAWHRTWRRHCGQGTISWVISAQYNDLEAIKKGCYENEDLRELTPKT